MLFLNGALKRASFNSLEISFFLRLDSARDFWVGDILRVYSESGDALAVLSKYAGAQSAIFTNPDTISLDILFNEEMDLGVEPIKLGRPGVNISFLGFRRGALFALSSETIYSKESPTA